MAAAYRLKLIAARAAHEFPMGWHSWAAPKSEACRAEFVARLSAAKSTYAPKQAWAAGLGSSACTDLGQPHMIPEWRVSRTAPCRAPFCFSDRSAVAVDQYQRATPL